MEAGFWHKKWQENDIGFHEGKANSMLVKYFKDLSFQEGSRVFLPLCGKTLDISWLLSSGYRVVGVELNAMAIDQLFDNLGIVAQTSNKHNVKHYKAKNIDIFVGDIFQLSLEIMGEVDVIYDRAALVALPEKIRNRYTAHLMKITNKAPQLLVTYEYDQKLMDGPPFSISDTEVKHHYSSSYTIKLVENENAPYQLKGQCTAKESVRLLENTTIK